MTKSLKLKVVSGKNAGRMIVIPPAGVILGRHPPSDLILAEPAVSRQHCSIYLRRNGWHVQDLESQNGTLVNGSPVTKQVLHPGDTIQVGDTLLRVPPRNLKPAIVGAATTAGVLVLILMWHWAAAQPGRSAAKPLSVTEQKSTPAATSAAGDNSPDSDLTDEDLQHPVVKRRHR